MSGKSSSNNGCAHFLGLLTILFIALKLTDQIDWSWVWVLSPILAPVSVLAVIIGGIGVYSYITAED